jgi:hypothetical protein
VHVEGTETAYKAALAAGAESVDPPRKVMDGVCVALVRAAGRVLIGFSGPTRLGWGRAARRSPTRGEPRHAG